LKIGDRRQEAGLAPCNEQSECRGEKGGRRKEKGDRRQENGVCTF